jgi:hypothetical protein
MDRITSLKQDQSSRKYTLLCINHLEGTTMTPKSKTPTRQIPKMPKKTQNNEKAKAGVTISHIIYDILSDLQEH